MKAGICRHYNSAFHESRCEAGVRYADVTPDYDGAPGSHYRMPCFSPKPDDPDCGPRGSCDKREEPSEAEIRETQEAIDRATRRLIRSLPLIEMVKSAHRGEDWQGVQECPECGGKLHMSHAKSNGHVWGLCETKGCLQWME